MQKIKYLTIKSLLIVGISLVLWCLIALVYIFVLKPFFNESIWKEFILGGSGYYSCVYANKI